MRETANMSTPREQARAVVWAGGFLIELASDDSLPLAVRQRAVMIARHFPTVSEVLLGRRLSERQLEPPQPSTGGEVEDDWIADCPLGPLTYATRLPWPDK